ncbi:MAG TPA: ABC transporter permease [Candidatus Acidoferrales bacterium]|jgi:predicted permease|nr:ABC transporter permease [Candidatus Acidoferrales bacterium]
MKSLRRFLKRVGNLVTRRSQDERLSEEIEGHIALQTDENLRAGLSPVEARRQAMLKFGGVEGMKEEYREARGLHFVESLVQDVRFAIRSLQRTPGLTLFVVITLALGIGMTSATFSMVDGLVFRPYPVPHPGNVVTLVSTTHDNVFDYFSYREYLDIRDKTKSYDGVIASADMEAVGFSAERTATPRIKGGVMVSGNYFQVLGVEPRLGRGFREDEDQVPGRNPVVVLGPDFWKHEFASDPSILGRTIRLNGTEFTVIGVAPDSFPGMLTFGLPDFYVPLAMARVFSTNLQKNFFEDRDDRELNVKARLKPDATLQQARNELARLAQDLEREYPKVNRGRTAAVYTLYETRTREDDNWKFGVVFAILALAVLLVACTNVAGLLLSRARARKREISIRLALGAGRFRLIRLLLTESLILAFLGGLAGVAIGYGVVEWFHSKDTIVFMTELPAAVPFRMDTRILLASLALAALSALLCGLAPALQSTRVDLVTGLKSADADVPGRKRLWGRNVLVVAQVSTSLMLLTASFLMARGFQHSLLEGTGFAKDHLLMVKFDPRLMQYNTPQTQQFYKLLAERMRETPGVRSEALTQNIPLGQDEFYGLAFVPDGFQMPQDRENFNSTMDTVDEGYFQTMGIPILQGRGFLASDTSDAPLVAVVNERFAKHYWPGGDAVGKHIRLDSRTGTPVEIVGVAQTIKYQSTFEKPIDFVYMPLAQHPIARMVLMLRSSGDPLQLVQPVKDVVRTLDANMPMLQTRSYEDLYVNAAVKGPGIAIQLVGTMGTVGLLLAVAGLYGLVAYNVSRRTHEIGIRMALGAGSKDVLRLVMGKGLVLVGMGTAIGLAMGFAVERLMNSVLFNAGGVDILAYIIVVPSMFLVTMLATYVPARRACRIAPTQALRYE